MMMPLSLLIIALCASPMLAVPLSLDFTPALHDAVVSIIKGISRETVEDGKIIREIIRPATTAEFTVLHEASKAHISSKTPVTDKDAFKSIKETTQNLIKGIRQHDRDLLEPKKGAPTPNPMHVANAKIRTAEYDRAIGKGAWKGYAKVAGVAAGAGIVGASIGSHVGSPSDGNGSINGQSSEASSVADDVTAPDATQ
ncbi:hypothetical protein FRB94_002660 [Tulasnella sp. JGI-2019a]|nr:hypothetical protein FRB94_002660 [Tulasnella sp. JGI-2019a]KAG9003603.1 hypothetical protein FRB93_011021 [Tulasnella sp. JGI-2019a]